MKIGFVDSGVCEKKKQPSSQRGPTLETPRHPLSQCWRAWQPIGTVCEKKGHLCAEGLAERSPTLRSGAAGRAQICDCKIQDGCFFADTGMCKCV